MLLSEVDYDPENPIPFLKNRDVVLYFRTEPLFMATEGYAWDGEATDLRDRAAFVISYNSVCENFDPLVPYLALNYFDRCPELKKDQPHDVDLIAISCLTLAWKMRDLNFTTTHFLAERPNLADVTTRRVVIMEICILKELNWGLRPVTAFCYVPYFAPLFELLNGISHRTVREIIIYAQYDIYFTQFRPSVIAASALLAAADFLYSDEIIHFFVQIISEPIFRESKAELQSCMEGMAHGCHALKLTIESGVSENESHPKMSVRAGQATSAEAPASARNNPSPSSQRLPDRKGKGKVEEIAETETEEESDDEQFGLTLRRRIPGIVINEQQTRIPTLDQYSRDFSKIESESNEDSGSRQPRQRTPGIVINEQQTHIPTLNRYWGDFSQIESESEEDSGSPQPRQRTRGDSRCCRGCSCSLL